MSGTFPWRVILFDFDGVILESVAVKTEAFRELFLPHGEETADAAVRLHLANLGMSRYEKFRILYEKQLGEPLSESRMGELDQAMSELILDGMLSCPMVPGVIQALEWLQGRAALHVVSGTPQDELRDIAGRRNLSRYFDDLRGSPTPKTELVRGVLADTQCPPDHAVLIGDATNDLLAARANGIHFIGRSGPDGRHPFDDEDVPVLPDLMNLPGVLMNPRASDSGMSVE